MDRLGELMQAAMAARAREGGERYTVRRLARDSGMHWTHAANVLRGKRRPTREVLEAWAAALAPHLDLDEALMAAGHPPTEERKARLIARLWRLGGEHWADLERWVGERVTVSAATPARGQRVTQDDTNDEGGGERSERDAADQPELLVAANAAERARVHRRTVGRTF